MALATGLQLLRNRTAEPPAVEQVEALQKIIAALPEREQKALKAYYAGKLPMEEIVRTHRIDEAHSSRVRAHVRGQFFATMKVICG